MTERPDATRDPHGAGDEIRTMGRRGEGGVAGCLIGHLRPVILILFRFFSLPLSVHVY